MRNYIKVILQLALSALEMSIAGQSNRGDVEKAKTLMKVADFHLARFNKSREIEQVANIFLWVTILVIGVFLIEKTPVGPFLIFSHLGSYYIFGAVVACLHFVWLCRSKKGMDADKQAYFKCRDRALQHIRSLEAIGAVSAKEFYASGWVDILMTGFTTLFLLWAVTFFALAKTDSREPMTKTKPVALKEVVTASEFSPNFYLDGLSPLKLTPAEALLGAIAE